MADVARRASVSPQTVSRVMRGHPSVSEFTRFRVEQAVEELGYRRAGISRALVTGRTMTLGVVSLDSSAYSRAAYVAGMTATARKLGYYVAAASSTSTAPEAVRDSIEHLRQQGIDGIVVAVPICDAGALDEATRGIPTVIIGGPGEEGLRAASGAAPSPRLTVWIDQVQGGRLATEHLLDLGHETVWHLAGPTNWADAAGRQAGWAATLAEHGIPEPPVLTGDWSADSGWRLGSLLARMDDVTAIFCASDDMAFGALHAMAEHGRRVPDDVAIVGMDDVALSAFAPVPLTTVRQPFYEMGSAAITLLVDLIERPEAEYASVVVNPELVVRKSSRVEATPVSRVDAPAPRPPGHSAVA